MKKGFTLIETMVAVSILMLAILGPLSIASSGLQNALLARDQITAYYLGQEGIEYVRYIRDDNYLRRTKGDLGRGWLYGLDKCEGTYGCYIDTYEWFRTGSYSSDRADDFITACSSDTCPGSELYVTSTGDYTHDSHGGNTATNYKRTVKLESVNSNEIKVTTTVTWQNGGIGQRTINVTEDVFDIYQTL